MSRASIRDPNEPRRNYSHGEHAAGGYFGQFGRDRLARTTPQRPEVHQNGQPALFFFGPGGQGMFCPESLADDSTKDDFATNARLVCIAYAATSVVMALEAWAKFAKPGEKFDMTEAPSEAFDRREIVVLMGESHSGQKQKFLPIIRSDNGKFFGFGKSEAPTMDVMKGRFAQLLPTKVPDTAMRDLAKAMLKVKGVGRARSGTSSRWPSSRC